MNTHYFDGKLLPDKALLHEHILRAESIPKDQKLNAFYDLRAKLSPNHNLNTIINDFNLYGHAPGPNYDPTNDLYADDLLYLCYELLQRSCADDLIKLLNEQFEEMSSGMCPQGRTHRLISVVLAYREFF
jgi:hypothetical protein